MIKLTTTALEWPDLVVDPHTTEKIQEILDRIKQGGGLRCLFYGPSGTGKTLTALLLGKSSGLEVYRIDLSKVVSKYIGETEKNISAIFNQSQNKNPMLFFDDTDALFGKRTQASGPDDRYANREISYLLQKIEAFPGTVILSSNLRLNVDEAFARAFQSIIHFPMPDEAARRQLWKQAFPDDERLEEKVDLAGIAAQYELSGGAISNVLLYCSIMAVKEGRRVTLLQDILDGIRLELEKTEGRSW
jgi:SpoVK/Ycf46/Vps4 family AAA+-type ATPase